MSQQQQTDGIMYFPWSENRSKIFQVLLEEPHDLRQIKDKTGLPRTTVRDNLNDLESLGWVSYNDGSYRPRPTGLAAYEAFVEYRDCLRVTNQFEPLFEYIDPDALDFDLDRLLEADLVIPTESDPLAPITRMAELASGADHLRAFMPVLDPGMLIANLERIEEGRLSYDLVAKPWVVKKFQNTYGMPGAPARRDNELDVFRGEFPFGISIFDDSIITIYGFDEMEGAKVLVESEADALLKWGLDTFEEYRESATAWHTWKSSSSQ